MRPKPYPPTQHPQSLDDPAAVRAAEEREARERELVATNRRLEEALKNVQRQQETTPPASIPPSRRRTAREMAVAAAPATGFATLLTLLGALAKPVIETRDELARVRVEVEQSRRAIDAAAAQKTLDILWKDYHRKRAKAEDCRTKQEAAALARLGYGISNVDHSGVRWVPDPPGPGWKKTGSPAQRADGDCPALPEPPEP